MKNVETFRRSPRADLEIVRNGRTIRIEFQSGFQGVNDIKEHKVHEAIRVFEHTRTQTICIHFDLFNGQAAFVPLNQISEGDVHWITRQQMEGQSIFKIDQIFFQVATPRSAAVFRGRGTGFVRPGNSDTIGPAECSTRRISVCPKFDSGRAL